MSGLRSRKNSPSGLPTNKRPEIQGLRAVAALLVVLFHLWPGTIPGGYIGVDIFFVISGYLITSHLVREIESQGRVHLAQFWARRARRLLPGAFLVLGATAIGIWLWVPEVRWPQFFREIIASTLYVENWSLAHDAVDYLAESNAASPVQHYWTLSAEEQFYIVWPLLVMLALLIAARSAGRRRLAIAAVLGSATAASLAYSIYLTQADPSRAFFVTPTRAWEFGAGALLALAPATRRLHPNLRAIVSWVALATMIGAAFVLDESTAMPGFAAIVVVASAVVFIAAEGPTQSWAPLAVLGRRPWQFTGDISYSLYLWHWPLIILLPYAQGHPNGNRTLFAILAITFVLATASTFLIENPIRSARALRIRVPAVTLAFTVAAAAILVVPSAAVYRAQGRAEASALAAAEKISSGDADCFGAASRDPERPCSNPALDRQMVPEPQFAGNDMSDRDDCASRPAGQEVVPCPHQGAWDDPDVPKVALVGDSHARMYSTTMDILAESGVLAYDGFFQSGCVWTSAPPVRTAFVDECNSFKRQLPDLLTRDTSRYDFIVTTGRTSKIVGTPDQRTQGLLDAWAPVTDLGIPVVAISDLPEVSPRINECLEQQPRHEAARCGERRSQALERSDPLLAAADRAPGGKAIDLRSYYCDGSTCPAVIGGATVYANSNHITATYARTLAPVMQRELQRLELLRR